MRNVFQRFSLGIASAMAAILMTSPAPASDIQVTVTNDQPTGGFALAPVWLAVQDGTFNAFTSGTTASSEIARLAQFGDTSLLAGQFNGRGLASIRP